jgi:hypothetical protein
VGQTFEVLTTGSITGTFGQIVTHGGLGVNVTYDANKVTVTVTSPLAIDENGGEDNIPNHYALQQNYPNPFSPSTTIKFGIPSSELVTLKVYDLTGREVAVLMNEQKRAGSYTIRFDADKLAAGVYFYRLEARALREIRKMLLVR